MKFVAQAVVESADRSQGEICFMRAFASAASLAATSEYC